MSLRGFDRMATFEAPGVRRACLFTYLSLLPFHRAVSLTFSGFFLVCIILSPTYSYSIPSGFSDLNSALIGLILLKIL